MKILFCCWPFEGHLFPQISIARACVERGDEVAFYTDRRWSETLAAQDLALHPFERVGPAWEAVRDLQREQGGRRQSLRVTRQTFRAWLAETIPDQVEDLKRVIADWRPDVIVTDHTLWGPSLVLREAEGIPVAIGGPWICALIPGPDAPPAGFMLPPPSRPAGRLAQRAINGGLALLARGLRDRLDQIRASYGLGPLGCTVNEFLGQMDLFLVLSVPEFDLNRWDLPPSVRYVGACQWYPRREAAAGDPLAGIPDGRPWVHVTDGTSNFQDPFLLRAAVEGLATLEVELIISKGRERRIEEFAPGSLPANVHVRDWLDYDALLPRCAAIVTVAGSGSTTAALQAGLPLVAVPTSWDQPDNALRIQESGAGVVIRPRRCSPEHLRGALEQVLGDPSYRAAAQLCADRLHDAPGPAGAASLIAKLAPDAGAAAQRSASIQSFR